MYLGVPGRYAFSRMVMNFNFLSAFWEGSKAYPLEPSVYALEPPRGILEDPYFSFPYV
jgi:hypothetical protein